MSDKQQILSAFETFSQVYEKLGWTEVSCAGHEDIVMYLVSPMLNDKIGNIPDNLYWYEQEKQINNLLREYPDDYVFILSYNHEPVDKKEKPLWLVHDFSEED